VLPAQGYAVFALVLVLAHGLALALARTRLPERFTSSRSLLLLLPLTALGSAVVGRPPSPVVDAAADVWEKVSTKSVRPSAGKARYATGALDHSQTPAHVLALPSPFKKIIVLVMETETAAAFALESKLLPAATFVHSGLAHAHRYERYFPNNQDSRTGMLDMLSSRFVPYDAYTEQGRDAYMFLSEKSSLPAEMHAQGYETAFAVSQNEIELVVGELPWQQRINLDDDKLNAAKERGLLCFTPYEFEHSCEDRALLPDVFAFLDTNERAFLYQEFIWGHASIYNQTSGKSNAAYYSSYVDALIEHLREQGTLDESLIVLTSDHGFRDTAMQDQLGVYRIPLWFYATRFEGEERGALYSHLDFKNLLQAEHTLSARGPGRHDLRADQCVVRGGADARARVHSAQAARRQRLRDAPRAPRCQRRRARGGQGHARTGRLLTPVLRLQARVRQEMISAALASSSRAQARMGRIVSAEPRRSSARSAPAALGAVRSPPACASAPGAPALRSLPGSPAGRRARAAA
jgi:hypothetical protein